MKFSKKCTNFAENVFETDKMKKALPQNVYKALLEARISGGELSEKDLQIFARALSKWAIGRGATRFAHTFCPLNNCTAGKRDSLYCLQADGTAALKFRAKELSSGEGDASSFPSGGMRQIYEARGITKWDVRADPYVFEDCLYIPCTFCGANGETLDTKTPLLRSNAALNKQALRVLKSLGEDAKEVFAVVGAEQEYFLIDKSLYDRRTDLVLCGRTVFGAATPKGQELRDNYFCPPNGKITEFMREVDRELCKLGILAKTEHREVAPHQFELAPCYERADIAADHNRMTQDVLCRVAEKHGLACILHEKPFDRFNGSGKHNNWSLMTDRGENLLEIGDMGWKNARFLLFLAAIVKAVDEYSELLCAVTSSRGNDCRLGGMEAPPRVLTIFLGQSVQRVVAYATSGKWRCGKDVLPRLDRSVDRNRTSPFAFGGNKFEFRSVGSSASVAEVNAALNTAVAESLRQFADRLENAPNVWKSAGELICETFAKHKKVIFEGDNYSAEWVKEAKLRNLKNCTSLDALESLSNAHCVNLLERHNVLSQREILARQKVLLGGYAESVCIELKVATEMFRKQVLGSSENYLSQLARTADKLSALGLDCQTETDLAATVARLNKRGCRIVATAERRLRLLDDKDVGCKARYCRDCLLPLLDALRTIADKLEALCPAKLWTMPTYCEMLFDTTV